MPGWETEVGDLIAEKRDELLVSVQQLEDVLVPRFRNLTDDVRRPAIIAVLVGIEHTARGAFPEHLVGIVEDYTATRLRAGISVVDLCFAASAYLPPVRRALVAHFGLEHGMELYERVEPRLLAGLRSVARAIERAAARAG